MLSSENQIVWPPNPVSRLTASAVTHHFESWSFGFGERSGIEKKLFEKSYAKSSGKVD